MTGLISLALPKQPPTRFMRSNFFPENLREELNRFLSLFHRYAYIYKPLSGGSWISAKQEWQLTDSEILKAVACAHPKYILGSRAGRASRFGVFDIDAGSKYHNPGSILRIMDLLSDAGIAQTSLYRSSESGGLHLYIFFDEPVSCRDMRRQLCGLLSHHGFEIAKGTFEVFPQTSDHNVGQGLRLPLQPGWAWLNPQTLQPIEERLYMSPSAALRQFLKDLDAGNSYHDFHRLKAHVERLQSQPKTAQKPTEPTSRSTQSNIVSIRNYVYSDSDAQTILEVFGSFPPNLNGETWLRGRNYWAAGLTQSAQRADAIFCMGHYLFYGDPERNVQPMGYGYEDERQRLIEHHIAAKHNGFSRELAAGTKDGIGQIYRATSWLPVHKRDGSQVSFSKKVPPSWTRGNLNRMIHARKKIAVAVQDFEEAGRPFSMRDLRIKSGCSSSTLAKHEDLWKPAQAKLQQGFFASDPGVFNGVERVAPQKSQPAANFSKVDMPPGRLAARRIIYELKMRDERERAKRAKSVNLFNEAYVESWTRQVANVLIGPIQEASTKELRFALSSFSQLLPRSPGESEQLMLMGRMTDIRAEIALRKAQRSISDGEGVVSLIRDCVYPAGEPQEQFLEGGGGDFIGYAPESG